MTDAIMSKYSQQLFDLCDWAKANSGTSAARTIEKVIMDIEGDGPIGGILFALDDRRFAQVVALLAEFRRTGRAEAFNSLHHTARQRTSA